MIERKLPGAVSLSAEEMRGIPKTSRDVLSDTRPTIQWFHSHVTDDKIYCTYIAPNEDMIRQHAEQGGFPANKVSQVRNTIDPTTAEA